MKRFAMAALLAVFFSTAFTACSPQGAQAPAANSTKAATDALILQADFAGLVMTGVAYSVSKDLDIYNVRPLIPLYDIRAASASLAYNAQTWPKGTVFVSVVDPGVGTARKSVVMQTNNGLFFVSPDNGSLSAAARQYGIKAVREIDESVNRRPGSEWSHTFHGRDVYSYTGARLAAGVITFEQVGPAMEPTVIMLDALGAQLENGVLKGFVAGGTGRLGNIFFSIDRHLFEQINPAFSEIYDVVIRKNNELVWSDSVPYTKSFGDVPVGSNLMFVNSSGDLSLAINQGNFAHKFHIGSGKDWTVEIRKHDEVASVDTTIPSRGVEIPVTWVHPAAPGSVRFPLVVMAHGHGGTRNEAGSFTQVAEGLARRGIASVRMDFPGCGDSQESFTKNNLSNMLADIQAARDFAIRQAHIDAHRLGLLGYSMGGRLVMLLSAQDTSYKVIATWAPAGENGNTSEISFLGGQEAYDQLKARAARNGFAPFTTSWGQHEQLGLQWFTDIEQSRPLDAIGTFIGPLLVLYGDRDTVVGPRISEQVIAAATRSSEVVRHVVAGANHGLGLFTNEPELTLEAVTTTVDFLSQHL